MTEPSHPEHGESPELVAGATYRYVPAPIGITDSMVERAFQAGATWFAEHADGASADDEWRDFHRTVLAAALVELAPGDDDEADAGRAFRRNSVPGPSRPVPTELADAVRRVREILAAHRAGPLQRTPVYRRQAEVWSEMVAAEIVTAIWGRN